ncbi:MAG: hypothetical protein JXB88_04820 [Spirochaetales bacterium]|nr:hypothetical protein [Spirochaetales bacterium]
MKNIEQFKRANFFTGLMATPQFWNDIQDYHFKKENFYNLLFLGPGIVPGIRDELKVSPIAKTGGSLSLFVAPGFAIDRQGRGINLYEPETKMVDYKKYKLPVTIYIAIMYHEILDEYYQNEQNTEYQGYKKKIETAKVEIIADNLPENCLELARIYLEEDENGEIKRITEPADYANPKANEIDTRFVLWAKKPRIGLSPFLKKYFVDILEESYNYAFSAFNIVNLPSLRELQALTLTSKMIVKCGDLAYEDIIHILEPIWNVYNSIAQDLIEYEKGLKKQTFTAKDAFKEYRDKLYKLGELIKYFDNKYETIDIIFKQEKAVIETLRHIFMTKKITLSDIELMSSDLPPDIVINDVRYRMVDFIDFNDKQAEQSHKFDKVNANNYSTGNKSATYPDGVNVQDIINIYFGGTVSFTLNNLIAARKAILIRRTDIFHGNYKIDVAINGEKTKPFVIDGDDTKNNWRNIALQIPGKYIKDNSITVSFMMEMGTRDCFGKIWMYQQI